DHAGGRRGKERLDERIVRRVQGGAEIRALGLHRAGVRIADVANRFRQAADVIDRFLPQRGLIGFLLEDRIALDIGALAALPRAAEPAQAIADVEQKRVALLLAIVADVDTGLDLLRHDGIHCRVAGGGEFGKVDRLAARAARIEPGQRERARQAAGMRRQYPLVATAHSVPVPVGGASMRTVDTESRGNGPHPEARAISALTRLCDALWRA